MLGFKNARIYVEGKGIVKTNLAIENGKIAYIGDDDSKITDIIKINDNQVVLPGFIDEHIHGAGGSDAMDGTTEALHTIATKIASEGTVGFLATTMTQSPKNITKAMKAVKEYCDSDIKDGAKVLGVHLEGPFISLKHIGAQPEKYVAKPSVDVFKKYNEASGNRIKIVTLAPEEDGSIDLIEYLKKNQIIASAGHTDAGYNEIEKVVKVGLSNITHTYNAQKALHHREVGTVGSAFLFDELNCEAICDLIHLSAPAIKLIVKNKPHDKVTLITDSMRAKHLPDGISELGGQTVIVKNGEARLENGALAGSILKMNDAIKNVTTKVGIPFLDVVDFATINPAKNLGLDKEMGSIKQGKLANFAIMNDDFSIALTIREGNIIYKK